MSQRSRILAGRYELDGALGQGGMAKVFRGTDLVLSRTVAVKVLAPNFARDQGFVARFRREAQSAARLNHPSVVSVYDTGSDDGIHYIVMEYVEGRTIGEVLREEGRLQPERAIEIAEAVASALSFAHAAGIVHRDVKPGNIMLTRTGEVKVMDFGIARAGTSDDLTQTATVLGTATYISPEQARGDPVDARSDIYSLGVVLYEMLTGRPPFSAESPISVAYKHVREDPELPSKLNPDIPTNLEAVVMKAMAKNPDNRYQTAAELREDLERVRQNRPVAATPILEAPGTEVMTRAEPQTAALPPQPPRPRRRRRVGLIVALTLLFLGGLAAGLFFLATELLDPTPTTKVPRVIGFNLPGAQNAIRGRNLKVGDIFRRNSGQPPGIVLNQDPEPGARVDQGSEVDLFVSKGLRRVEVPRLVGLTESEARAALEERDLFALVSRQESETEAGRVISQTPPEGTSVEVRTTVTFVVSSGPELVTVPDVECKPVAAAQAALEAVGLVMEVVGEDTNPACPREGRVVEQEPEAGTVLEKGSAVQVLLSEPPPSPSPSPSPEPTASPS